MEQRGENKVWNNKGKQQQQHVPREMNREKEHVKKMLPTELVVEIMKKCDLRTRTQFLVVNWELYWEAKRMIKTTIEDDMIISTITDGIITIRKSSNKRGGYAIRYYKNNLLHRENGEPACVQFKNGKIVEKRWYKNGELDNENAPSIVWWHDNGVKWAEKWFKDGKRHRENDFAIQNWDSSGETTFKAKYKNGKLFGYFVQS